jgi:hypothetical protein
VAKRVQLGFISDQVTPTLYNIINYYYYRTVKHDGSISLIIIPATWHYSELLCGPMEGQKNRWTMGWILDRKVNGWTIRWRNGWVEKQCKNLYYSVTGSRYADCHCYPTAGCRHCYATSKRSIVISIVTGSYSRIEPTAMHWEWTTDVSPVTNL